MTGITESTDSRTVFTSDILVVLKPDPDTRQQLLRWLWALSFVDVGAIESGLRLNITVRHETRAEESEFWEALQSHPAVHVASLSSFHEDKKAVAR